jgi:AcrR family transcriptional regulator
MPKRFSEREKEIIQAKLLKAGADYLARHGIRKTNVEDLTKAGGISKGAFYLFYDSKEDLFFDILQQFEADYQAHLLEEAARVNASPTESVKQLLRRAFSLWKTEPLFRRFDKEEYEYFLRRLPEEKVQTLLQKDYEFIRRLIAQWKKNNILIRCNAKMFANLMRALFFISLHEEDFDKDTYPEMIYLMIDSIIERVVK